MKFILFLILNLSCGTETGNPKTEPASSFPENGQGNENTVAYQVLEKSCEKLNECFYLELENCKAKLGESDGFDGALGLAEEDYDQAETIMQEEAAGNLVVASTVSKDQCYTDIEELSCTDSEVINAYDTSNSSDYTNAYKIVPIGSGSCQDIYENDEGTLL